MSWILKIDERILELDLQSRNQRCFVSIVTYMYES